MQAMTRQLAGQQLPKAEVGSAGVGNGFGEGANDLFNSAMLQEAAYQNNPAEKLPQRAQSLDGRSQFRTLMGIAPEAVEQTGVTVRTPISVDTNTGKSSGLLFDGQRHRTDRQLNDLRHSDVLGSTNRETPMRQSAISAPKTTETSAFKPETARHAQEIDQLTLEARKMGKKKKAKSAGQNQLASLQTNQAPKIDNRSLFTQLTRFITDTAASIKADRSMQFRMAQQARQAKLKTLTNGRIEAGKEASAIANMENNPDLQMDKAGGE